MYDILCLLVLVHINVVKVTAEKNVRVPGTYVCSTTYHCFGLAYQLYDAKVEAGKKT